MLKLSTSDNYYFYRGNIFQCYTMLTQIHFLACVCEFTRAKVNVLDYPPCLLLPQSKYTDRRSYIANLHHFHPPDAQFRHVANQLNGTFALMPRGWISRLIKIPQPSKLHTTYLFRYSRRWYAQKNMFKPEVSKNSVAMATYLN